MVQRSRLAKNTLTSDAISVRAPRVSLWIQLFVAVTLPAIVVASVPQRWLRRAMLFWVLLPLVVFFCVITWEIMTSPEVDNALGKALFALLLVGSIAAVPWLIACAIGFGLGFALRRLLGRVPPKANSTHPIWKPTAATSNATAAPPGVASSEHHAKDHHTVSRGFPNDAVLSGWRAIHVGFENDGLKIGDLEVWRWPWHSAGLAPLRLPHPTHPAQTHDFNVYDIGEAPHSIRFAAAELSNSVWGFYVAEIASVGDTPQSAQRSNEPHHCYTAPDATLRVEIESVEWFNTHWVNTPRVIDINNGRVLLDLWGTDWDAVASFPAPRFLRLGMRRYRNGASLTLELDLVHDSYRISFDPAAPQASRSGPISEVAQALEANSVQHSAQPTSTRSVPAATIVPMHFWPALRSAVLILAGALVAIALATWWTLDSMPASKPELDTLPEMPDIPVE